MVVRRRALRGLPHDRGQAGVQARHGAGEGAHARARSAAEFGSILVPVLGTPLDDDIMQTAGRLAGRGERGPRRGRRGDRGAVGVRDADGAAARRARVRRASCSARARRCARAKAVGEEYEGVEVATATVRARRAGEAIVHEAKRRGVEAIVLAAEEPTGIRGGLLARRQGGPARLVRRGDDRYVLQKAPCRVILTAPPSGDGRRRPDAPVAGRRRRSIRSATRRWRRTAPRRLARVPARCSSSSSEPAASAPPSPPRPCAPATPSPCSTRTRSRTSGSTSSSARRGRRPAAASRSAPRSSSTR